MTHLIWFTETKLSCIQHHQLVYHYILRTTYFAWILLIIQFLYRTWRRKTIGINIPADDWLFLLLLLNANRNHVPNHHAVPECDASRLRLPLPRRDYDELPYGLRAAIRRIEHHVSGKQTMERNPARVQAWVRLLEVEEGTFSEIQAIKLTCPSQNLISYGNKSAEKWWLNDYKT